MKKRLQVKMVNNNKGVSFMGVDYKGAPYVLFKQLAVSGLTAKINQFSLEKKQT